MNSANAEVVPGIRISDLPTERDALWDFADAWIAAHGAAMDTWDREQAWGRIVAAGNPDWVVGLSRRRRPYVAEQQQPLASRPAPGVQIRIMQAGQLIGPFRVTGWAGRTDEHLVLRGPSGLFEHYWDPYNTWPA